VENSNKEPQMKEYIAFDSHKRYTLAEREDRLTGAVIQQRIEHHRGAICDYLMEGESGTDVAVEATGNWYWIVSEIEQAGKTPRLVHPRKAKLMMGQINKTDKLDVHGLNRLQRNQTLPTVWIPPASLRDLRELTRGRMVFSRQRARLKNRLQATLAKYGLIVEGVSDVFGDKGRMMLEKLLEELPEQTQWMSRLLLEELDLVEKHLEKQEQKLRSLLKVTEEMKRLEGLPGVGLILSGVMALEIGDISRFASGERLASYAGTTPRVTSSGGKTRYGPSRADVNRYLKWSLMEAANVISLHHSRWSRSTGSNRHVSVLYERIKKRKGHAKAIGAVARHLAEASWHVLSRKTDYRPPGRPACRVGQQGVSAVSS
jgi:transposase